MSPNFISIAIEIPPSNHFAKQIELKDNMNSRETQTKVCRRYYSESEPPHVHLLTTVTAVKL
jgi:hypothetical protein